MLWRERLLMLCRDDEAGEDERTTRRRPAVVMEVIGRRANKKWGQIPSWEL
jgi:hypothetical protein